MTAETRKSFDEVNREIAAIQSSVGMADSAARKAREADPMHADVEEIESTSTVARKAHVDALRSEITIRQGLPGLFAQAAHDVARALEEAESRLDFARREIRSKLAEIGFSAALAGKDGFGLCPLEPFITCNDNIAPLVRRVEEIRANRMTPATWQSQNRFDLQRTMERLKEIIAAAAGETTKHGKGASMAAV